MYQVWYRVFDPLLMREAFAKSDMPKFRQALTIMRYFQILGVDCDAFKGTKRIAISRGRFIVRTRDKFSQIKLSI